MAESVTTPVASILTVGDELLIGQVVNSNAAWMGEALSQAGYVVTRHLVVGDRETEIQCAVRQCLADSEVVLVSGGLGPTSDDLTAPAVTALWPRAQCAPISNDCGTAAGVWIDLNENDLQIADRTKKTIFLMPGVPFEMKSMMTRVVLPELARRAGAHKVIHRTLHTAGAGESVLAKTITGVESLLSDSLTLAYLPSAGEVRLRISARAAKEQEAEQGIARVEAFIRERLSAYIYGTDGDTLEAAVGRILVVKNLTIAVAESCTGGLINHRLTNVSGSSRYLNGGIVTYSNAVKTKELGVGAALFTTVGAVSAEVARAMAEGVRAKFDADVGVGITGIAGPDGGTPEKPVGTVYIAVCDAAGTEVVMRVCGKDRLRNKERFATAALNLVRLRLFGQ